MEEHELSDVGGEVLATVTGDQDLLPDDTTSSAMDRLRKAREEILEHTTIDLTIPGYGGELVSRHRAVEFKEMREWGREIMKATRDPDERQMQVAVQVIARTCVGIYLRPNGSGEVYPLDPDNLGVPCRYDERFAEFMGFRSENQRSTEVVLGVFGERQLLIVAFQQKYSQWLGTANQEVDTEMGEG